MNTIQERDMEELFGRREIPVENLKNKRILITGAGGMLASYLVHYFAFLNQKHGFQIQIYGLIRNQRRAQERFASYLKEDFFHLIKQDVCEPFFIEEEKLDYILHLAGNASPRHILEDPVGIIKSNTLGTLNVLDLAREKGVKRVLYASTREVYGRVPKNQKDVSEEDYGVFSPTDLRACYPESKRMAESILSSYFHQHQVDYVTARIAHAYGPGMALEGDGRVMSDFISDIVHQRDIVLKSKGMAERAFCYLTDAISGLLLVLLKGESTQAYNVANETEPMEIREVAQLLTEISPTGKSKVVFEIPEEMSVGYSRMGRTKLNTSKIEKLGFQCRVSIREGMKRTVDSFLEEMS